MTERQAKQAFAERLKEAREYLGFTREQAATAIGIELSTLWQWETGKCGISDLQLDRAARLYGCSADTLLGLDKPDTREEEDRALAEAFPNGDIERITEHDRREILRFMDFLRHVGKKPQEGQSA